MEGKYDVVWNAQTVGTVTVKREGLYCRVDCRCMAVDQQIHRLYAGEENLGVLIPDRGELALEIRVAAKRLKKGCTFTLDESRMDFVPIHPGEAFEYLDKIRLGKLDFRNGNPGLILE